MPRKPTRRAQLGLTIEQYEDRLAKQDGHCALCPATPKTRRLNVDHDHKTGKVRALLCNRCNRALPSWVTSAWLRDAAMYLDRHAKDQTCAYCGEPSYRRGVCVKHRDLPALDPNMDQGHNLRMPRTAPQREAVQAAREREG